MVIFVSVNYPELQHLQENYNIDNIVEFYRTMKQSRFTLKDIGVSSRAFTNWKKNGLIPFAEEGRSVRLNVLEFFWVNVVKDLREVNMPIDMIAEVTKLCFQPNESDFEQFNEDGTFTDEMMAYCKKWKLDIDFVRSEFAKIIERYPDYLQLVYDKNPPFIYEMFKEVLREGCDHGFAVGNNQFYYMSKLEDGSHVLDDPYYFVKLREAMDYHPMIVVSFKKYLHLLVSNEALSAKVKKIDFLSEAEWDVVKAMQEGKAKEITIVFNGKHKSKDVVLTYTGKASEAEIQKMTNIFFKKTYTELQLKRNTGEESHFEYTDRKRYEE